MRHEMRHDWIFDVLADLRQYAQLNGLPATARAAGDALAVVRHETGQTGPMADRIEPVRRVSGG